MHVAETFTRIDSQPVLSDFSKLRSVRQMAITQQLARLDGVQLGLCASDVITLGKLLDPHSGIGAERLDMNWTPAFLCKALAELGLSDLADSVRVATDGEAVLNAEFPRGPSDYPVFDGEIRCVSVPSVRRLAERLSYRPDSLQEARQTLARMEMDGWRQPAQFLLENLHALAVFYAAAAEAGDAVAVWWD